MAAIDGISLSDFYEMPLYNRENFSPSGPFPEDPDLSKIKKKLSKGEYDLTGRNIEIYQFTQNLDTASIFDECVRQSSIPSDVQIAILNYSKFLQKLDWKVTKRELKYYVLCHLTGTKRATNRVTTRLHRIIQERMKQAEMPQTIEVEDGTFTCSDFARTDENKKLVRLTTKLKDQSYPLKEFRVDLRRGILEEKRHLICTYLTSLDSVGEKNPFRIQQLLRHFIYTLMEEIPESGAYESAHSFWQSLDQDYTEMRNSHRNLLERLGKIGIPKTPLNCAFLPIAIQLKELATGTKTFDQCDPFMCAALEQANISEELRAEFQEGWDFFATLYESGNEDSDFTETYISTLDWIFDQLDKDIETMHPDPDVAKQEFFERLP